MTQTQTKKKVTPAPGADKRPPTFDRLRKKKPLEATVTVFLDDETLVAAADARSEAERLETLREIKPDAVTDGELEAARAARDAAEDELREHAVKVRFRSIGRHRYEKMVREHPATDEQVAEFQAHLPKLDAETATPEQLEQRLSQKPPYDGEEFPIALISASAVEPVLSEDEVRVLYQGGFVCPECGRIEFDRKKDGKPCKGQTDDGAKCEHVFSADEDWTEAWNPGEYTELFMGALEVNNARRIGDLGKARG